MPDQLQLRGGTTSEHSSFTGALREVTVDTTKKTLVVHDGSQAGGTPLMKESGATAASSVQIGTGGVERLKLEAAGVVFNETGADVDFRIEGDTLANLFYVNAGTDRVGINTNSPLGHLGIAAAAGTSGTTASAGYDEIVIEGGNEHIGMCFLSPAANNVDQTIAFGDSNNNKSGLIRYEHSNDAFRVDTGGSERMRIDSSGNVGIGVTTIQDRLHIANNGNTNIQIKSTATGSGANAGINVKSADGGDYIIQTGNAMSGGLRVYDAGVNAERIRLTSTGKVGIGTSTPEVMLDIRANDPGIQLVDTSGTNAYGNIDFVGDTLLLTSRAGSSDGFIDFRRYDGTTIDTSMRIASDGKIGIGTTSPSHALHIAGNVAGDQRVLIVNSNTANTARAAIKVESDGSTLDMLATSAAYSAVTGWGDAGVLTTGSGTSGGLIFNSQASSSAIKFMTQASERMRVHTNGRVSIGTTTADATLHVKSPDGSNTRVILEQTLDAANYQNGLDFKNNGTQYAGITAGKDGSNNSLGLIFHTGTSFTSRLQISDEGIVKTSSSNHALGVSTTASAGTNKYNFRGHHSGTAGSTASGTISFTVWSNGNVENTNNSYGQISDETLKQDIVDASSQWNDIKNITVRKFRFKDNPTGELQIGVVAQEVEKVSAGLVYETGDVGKEVKAVKYSVLYMKAIKALQEAITKIETLETKVAALEAA